MSNKRIYQRSLVKEVVVKSLLEVAKVKGGGQISVGLDIGKAEIVAVVRWQDRSSERPWSVKNPSEIPLLIEILLALQGAGKVTVGLESTGTYGEAIRYALGEANLEVHRINGKSVCDYKEIFDGVPSQHDGKDAAIIAELTAFDKGTPWPVMPKNATEQEMQHQVARLAAFHKQSVQWMGRLEGVLARHCPELTSFLKVSSATALNICAHYGNPAQLASDESAADRLHKYSRSRLETAKISDIIESARTTCGIPMGVSESAWLQEIATQALSAAEETNACHKRLRELALAHEAMSDLVDSVGGTTLCVIWLTVGDPKQYASSGAFLKALGLNMKELSSGKRKGELAITKRGPSVARKILYFWALRGVQHPALQPWFEGFKKVGRNRSGEHRGKKGLIALMRKLCRSLWYVRQHNVPFEYAKVFPGEPLQKRTRKRKRRKTEA